MHFDPENNIVKLCAEGMGKEFEGKMDEAAKLFLKAWDESSNDFEKFTAAHYVARHQITIADKLLWDETALSFALKINDDKMNAMLPSLYLNVAKCYEDLEDFDSAKKNYEIALTFCGYLPKDGYGKLIRSGIDNGLERISARKRG